VPELKVVEEREMEWKTEIRPKKDQHRERLKFAWFPIECEDGKTRWLCKVRVLEIFSFGFDGHLPVFKWDLIRAYPAEFEKIRKGKKVMPLKNKLAVLVFLLVASTVFCQTANVLELTPADQARAQKAWDAKQKADVEWDRVRADIGNRYASKAPCVASLSGVWPPSNEGQCIHQAKEGFESGFEFSSDFRFIVPKVAEPKSNTWPNTYGFYPERYLYQLN
jgi:hypothetical protein